MNNIKINDEVLMLVGPYQGQYGVVAGMNPKNVFVRVELETGQDVVAFSHDEVQSKPKQA